MNHPAQWSKPYYGLQHIGQFSIRTPWGTVEDCGTSAKALCWFPGCQFSPIETRHKTAAEARKHVENWMGLTTTQHTKGK